MKFISFTGLNSKIGSIRADHVLAVSEHTQHERLCEKYPEHKRIKARMRVKFDSLAEGNPTYNCEKKVINTTTIICETTHYEIMQQLTN